MGLETLEILRWKLRLEDRHLVSERALWKPQYFMKPGRQIRLAGSYIPIPQAVVRATRRKSIAFLAQSQLFERSFPLYGAADDPGSGLQYVDFGAAPYAFEFAIIEAEKTPPFPFHHDRDGQKRQGAVIEKYLPRISGDFAQRRLDHFPALPPSRPFTELAWIVFIHQVHVLIERIRGNRLKTRLRPVETAALYDVATWS